MSQETIKRELLPRGSGILSNCARTDCCNVDRYSGQTPAQSRALRSSQPRHRQDCLSQPGRRQEQSPQSYLRLASWDPAGFPSESVYDCRRGIDDSPTFVYFSQWIVEKKENGKYILKAGQNNPAGPLREHSEFAHVYAFLDGQSYGERGHPAEWEITRVIDTQHKEGWM